MTSRLVATAGRTVAKNTPSRGTTHLVGRPKSAYPLRPCNDPYFSSRHFLFGVNPTQHSGND